MRHIHTCSESQSRGVIVSNALQRIDRINKIAFIHHYYTPGVSIEYYQLGGHILQHIQLDQ